MVFFVYKIKYKIMNRRFIKKGMDLGEPNDWKKNLSN